MLLQDDDDLPYHIKCNLIYKCKIRQSKQNIVSLALVKKSPENGPYLHEIQNKNMLSTWNLIETILKGMILVDSNQAPIQITCHFVYTQTRRLMLYFLKINKILLILGKDLAGMTMIYKQYENIKSFKIIPNKTVHGQCNIILTKIDGSLTEEFNLTELICCIFKKSAATKIPSVQGIKPASSYIIQKLQTDLIKSKVELNSIKLQKQQLFNSFATKLKFGFSFIRGNTIEEKQMLAKYGDMWIKTHNKRLVLGIPVFNCTFARKRVLRNIHALIKSVESPNLIYTQNLYQCRLDSTGMFNLAELLQYDETLSDDMTLKFNKEWISDENKNNLMPEMSGCLIVAMDQPHFNHQKLPYSYQCFILYEILDETTNKIHKLQNYAGEFSITTDIIFNENYFIQFNNSDCFFKDLLAVTATSNLQVYDMNFDTEKTAKYCFNEIIVKQLSFSHIETNLAVSQMAENTATDQSINEISQINKKLNNDDDLMEVDDEIDDLFNFHQRRPIQNPNNSTIGAIINRNCETKDNKLNDIFFQKNDGHFKGILIRRNMINQLQYRIKIYCGSNENGLDLIELLSEQLNKLVKFTKIYRNVDSSLMALKELNKVFEVETDFVVKHYSEEENNCKNRTINELINLRMKRLQFEYETDKKLNELFM